MPCLLRAILLLFFYIFSVLVTHSQNSDRLKASEAESIFETIKSKDRYTDNTSSLLSENEAANLPIGIKKNAGNTPITIAVSNIQFQSDYSLITLYVEIEMPNQENHGKSKSLYFGATNVKLSYDGDLVGDIQLSLLSDINIPLGNLGNFTIKGSFNEKTGLSTSFTSILLECNGDFKELSLDAELELNKNTFKKVIAKKNTITNESTKLAQDTIVRTSVRGIVSDINDILVTVSLPEFEIRSIPGFVFEVSEATLDLSDKKNSQNFKADTDYFQKYFTVPDRNLWRGLYIGKFSVSFPSQFKKKDGSIPVIGATNLLIDEMGVTGSIFGKNILDIGSGDASGCPFSVTDFELSLLTNNIKGFGFGGKIGVPLSNDSTLFSYKAQISKNEYLFNVALTDSMEFNLFGPAKLKLQPSSYIEVLVKNGRFVPKAVLNGSMYLDKEGLKIEQLEFRKLCLSTASPVLSFESIRYGGDLKLNNFPISISDIQLTSKDDLVSLAFDAKLNLMKDKITPTTRLTLSSEYKDKSFKFKGLSISKIKLENVQLSGFTLDGEIGLEKNHEIYGNYFGGSITAKFGALSEDLKVNVRSVFGCKDYRYWYVDGEADFPSGVPVGPIAIKGFVGGVYYRVKATGKPGIMAYAPDDKNSLGLKAGVKYTIGGKAVKGKAIFETNFLSSGGIRDIKFYADAEFTSSTDLDLGTVGKMYRKAQTELADLSEGFAAKLPGNMNGSDIAKKILPDLSLSASISAYLTMNYDFLAKEFDANFKVMVNAPGGLLKGKGNNNEAGWAQLYASPKTWFIHIGKPSNPIGLQLGLGPLSLTTESYFMLGDQLERPILDPNVSRILGITPQQADYMKLPEIASQGKGIAFGSRFSFNTGDIRFLILYANFMAGAGFDVMLQDMSDFACKGSNSKIGLDGWYANGQCYAYLQGELGVQIKLLFIKKKIAIIKGSAAALLQARLPNPTWIGGYMAVRVNVLGGLINANMKMKFSFGDACELVNVNGEYSPLDFPIISDLTPLDKSTEIDVFASSQATFNMTLGEAFESEDDQGKNHTYRIQIENFDITDESQAKIVGKLVIARDKMSATFEPHEVLPPYKTLKARIAVTFEELVNGTWKIVSQGGKPAREIKEVSFTTGEAPNYIPLTNIEYSYPVIDQKNFLKGETNVGYIQLKRAQTYLFPANFDYKTVFKIDQNTSVSSNFKYSSADKNIQYTIPNLNNSTTYKLSLIASVQGSTAASSTVKKTTTSISDAEGETFTIDYNQQAADQIVRDGQMEILNYTFRTSKYNTFNQKVSSLTLTRGAMYVNTDVRALYLKTGSTYEKFDESDLFGSPYSSNKPLISAEAILDDNYFVQNINPLIYKLYPYQGMTIQNRDPNLLGVPPTKGFSIYDGYLEGLNNSGTVFPIVYQVQFYYSKDYYELRNKAANLFDKGINMQPLLPLIQSQFPAIRVGNYKTKLKYIMPNSKAGTTKEIQYNYW